ncbi:MAG: hypothetical protein A3I29_03395 [Candidatus Magasanikbacteria bacterium RIFCSPLOWO2_02_FULL_44_11]|uniref:Phosphomannomutase/phosphoglucomutase n=1 Tax=Candidatus Magasanikbacteria bacterium RIFCSPLOWO2_02_FULL_44_11 TaxID=1798689 RepID=A0A1F6NB23_9BACT|nr:MAG: hypothetical protein A3I29_03395 [Candidatus Magasanikbacteria bacterium RIFCSPLOWO2_02_FULL_44_11]
MVFPTHTFKAYDIRGLVEGELSVDLAYRIGRAFGIFLKKNYHQNLKVVVGRDMRESSPGYESAVVGGLTDEGWNVVEIGLATTPLFNFACAHYAEHAGGIMITASHNPAQYNGFKMTLGNGLPVGKKTGMSDIRDLVEQGKFGLIEKKGTVEHLMVLGDYLKKVLSLVDVKSLKPCKVVIDCGNGMADVTFSALLEKLPVKVDYLFRDPDGRFPNHEANPLKAETLRDLQRRVVETGADFGFALDGDADRVGLVDEEGKVVDPSFVGVLLGLEVLRKHPKAVMLYDLRSSMIVPETWEAHGAITEKCMVGHALIKKDLKEKGAMFASELSLHLYYHDMYDVESSDLSLLYVLQMLSREKKKLSALVAPLKKYAHSGEINFETKHAAEIIVGLVKKYAGETVETSHLDGLFMRLSWGWMNVRMSNTEPLLRLNLETPNKEITEEKIVEIGNFIKNFTT